MSIALQAQVDRLEKRVEEIAALVKREAIEQIMRELYIPEERWEELRDRVAAIESAKAQTAKGARNG